MSDSMSNLQLPQNPKPNHGEFAGGKPGRPVSSAFFSSGAFSSGTGGDDPPDPPDTSYVFGLSENSNQSLLGFRVETCPKCGGDGKKRRFIVIKTDDPCKKCDGTGQIVKSSDG